MSFQISKTCQVCGSIYWVVCETCQENHIAGLRRPEEMTGEERAAEVLSYQSLPEIPGFHFIETRVQELIGRPFHRHEGPIDWEDKDSFLKSYFADEHLPEHNNDRGWQSIASEARSAYLQPTK
jgi:hypothetical protein